MKKALEEFKGTTEKALEKLNSTTKKAIEEFKSTTGMFGCLLVLLLIVFVPTLAVALMFCHIFR